MIILDCSEQRTNSITSIPDAKSCTWLEEKSGADLMITPLSLPLVPATFEKHMKSGAILVQVKHGGDFTNSIGERLNTAIAKMVECAPYCHYWQRLLIITGVFIPDYETGKMLVGAIGNSKNGKVWIIWKDSGKDIKAYYSSLRHWIFRGGSVQQLANANDLNEWLTDTEKDLKFILDNPTKEVWPNNLTLYDPPMSDDPLQLPIRVTDFRVTLATFPGIGPVRANELWHTLGPNAANILCWLSDPGDAQVKGIGNETTKKIREYLGLDECRLWLEPRGDVQPEFSKEQLEALNEAVKNG